MKTKLLNALIVLVYTWYAFTGHAQPFTGAGAGSFISPFNNGSTSHGNYSVHFTTTGSYNTAMGQYTLYTNMTGAYNTATGSYSLYYNTGSNNTANGYKSLYKNTTGEYNTAIGNSSMLNNNLGSYNTATGRRSLYSNTTGSENTANGANTLYQNSTGTQNSAIGAYALYNNMTGSYNTAGGYKSLYTNTGANQTGSHNTAYGHYSLYANTGNNNTAAGASSLAGNTSGYENTAVGAKAMTNNTTGWQNTTLGYQADVVAGMVINNATAIGYNAVVKQTNTMRFGDDEVIGCGFWADPNTAFQALVVGQSALGGGFRPGNGAYCSNGGVWTDASSKELKEEFTMQDPQTILDKINKLSVTKWKYKKTMEYHIGPVAEDFFTAFNVGCNNKSISTIDPSGVALLGIQALSKKQDDLAGENEHLKKEIRELKDQHSDLQKRIEKLESFILASSKSDASLQSVKTITVTNAALEQNIPNPLTTVTSIHYNLPANAKNAQLLITDVSGKAVKQIALQPAGQGVLNVDATLLSNGTYNYALLIDGKIAVSKKMVVAK